jgi:hypothetical protein
MSSGGGRLRACAACALGAIACVTVSTEAGADCIDFSYEPALPPPPTLWDHPDSELRAGAIVIDSTRFNGTQLDNGMLPRPADVDVEDGIVFVAYRGGFQIRDGRADLAPAPMLLSWRGLWEGHFPTWTAPTAEFRDILWGIDAPAGEATIVAIVGIAPVGFSVWGTTNPVDPVPRYIDKSVPWLLNVYATRIGGSTYAFTADRDWLYVYDLDAAGALAATCIDSAASGDASCGVLVTKVAGAGRFLDGVEVAGKTLVVTSDGSYGQPYRGVKVWDVSQPGAPALLATGTTDKVTWGIGAWAVDDRPWVGVRTESSGAAALEVFDLGDCLAGPCTLPQPAAVVPLAQDAGTAELSRVVSTGTSRDGPLLYTASLWSCVLSGTTAVQRQRDYLFDMRNPAQPREVSPARTIEHLGRDVDYWSWYYPDQLGGDALQKGYNMVTPGGAAFAGPYVYRAFGTLFDVHEWLAPPAGEDGGSGGEGAGGAMRGDGGGGAQGGGGAHGGDGATVAEGDAGGCGCRTAPRRANVLGLWVAALVAAVPLARRRARRCRARLARG